MEVGRAGRNVGVALSGLASPLAIFGAVATRVSASFEESMNKVEAVTEASTQEMARLEAVARQMGATTRYSATDAADAMGYLGQAGFSVTEMAEGLPGVLNMAAAANIDLAKAADIASGILRGFSIDAREMDMVADVLAKTAARTNTDIQGLGYAFSYAGPIAKMAGQSFEDTAAAIGILANQGIDGERAGTALRGAITRLLRPPKMAREALDELNITIEDSSGNMRSLADIMIDLEKAGATTAQMMKIFGQEAGTGMVALLAQGGDAVNELSAELDNSEGAAAKMAATMEQGLIGAIHELESAWEELLLSLGVEGGLLQLATDIVHGVTEIVKSFGELSPETMKLVTRIGLIAVAAGPVLIVVGQLTTLIAAALNPIGLMVTGIIALGSAFTYLVGKYGSVQGMFAAFRGAAGDVVDGFVQGLQTRASQLADAAGRLFVGFISAVKNILGIHSPSTVMREIGINTVEGFLQGFGGARSLAEANAIGAQFMNYLFAAMEDRNQYRGALSAMAGYLGTMLGFVFDRARETVKPIWNNMWAELYDGTDLQVAVDAARAQVDEFVRSFRVGLSNNEVLYGILMDSAMDEAGNVTNVARYLGAGFGQTFQHYAVPFFADTKEFIVRTLQDIDQNIFGGMFTMDYQFLAGTFRGLRSAFSGEMRVFLKDIDDMSIPEYFESFGYRMGLSLKQGFGLGMVHASPNTDDPAILFGHFVGELTDWISDAATGISTNFMEAFRRGVEGYSVDYEMNLLGVFGNLVGQAVQIGRDFMDGFGIGVAANASRQQSEVVTWFNDLVARIKSFLGIQSPSTVMAEVGSWFMSGFVEGAESQTSALYEATFGLFANVVEGVKVVLAGLAPYAKSVLSLFAAQFVFYYNVIKFILEFFNVDVVAFEDNFKDSMSGVGTWLRAAAQKVQGSVGEFAAAFNAISQTIEDAMGRAVRSIIGDQLANELFKFLDQVNYANVALVASFGVMLAFLAGPALVSLRGSLGLFAALFGSGFGAMATVLKTFVLLVDTSLRLLGVKTGISAVRINNQVGRMERAWYDFARSPSFPLLFLALNQFQGLFSRVFYEFELTGKRNSRLFRNNATGITGALLSIPFVRVFAVAISLFKATAGGFIGLAASMALAALLIRSEALPNVVAGFREAREEIKPFLQLLGEVIGAMGVAIREGFVPAMNQLSNNGEVFRAVGRVAGELVNLFIDVGTALLQVGKNWQEASGEGPSAFMRVGIALTGLLNNLANGIAWLNENIVKAIDWFNELPVGVQKTIVFIGASLVAFNLFSRAVTSLAFGIVNFRKALAMTFGGQLMKSLPLLFALNEVFKETGRVLALVAARFGLLEQYLVYTRKGTYLVAGGMTLLGKAMVVLSGLATGWSLVTMLRDGLPSASQTAWTALQYLSARLQNFKIQVTAFSPVLTDMFGERFTSIVIAATDVVQGFLDGWAELMMGSYDPFREFREGLQLLGYEVVNTFDSLLYTAQTTLQNLSDYLGTLPNEWGELGSLMAGALAQAIGSIRILTNLKGPDDVNFGAAFERIRTTVVSVLNDLTDAMLGFVGGFNAGFMEVTGQAESSTSAIAQLFAFLGETMGAFLSSVQDIIRGGETAAQSGERWGVLFGTLRNSAAELMGVLPQVIQTIGILVTWLAKAIQWFANADPVIQRLVIGFAIAVKAVSMFGAAIAAVGQTITITVGLVKTLWAVSQGITTLAGFLGGLSSTVAILSVGLVAAAAALYFWYDAMSGGSAWSNLKRNLSKNLEVFEDYGSEALGSFLKGFVSDDPILSKIFWVTRDDEQKAVADGKRIAANIAKGMAEGFNPIGFGEGFSKAVKEAITGKEQETLNSAEELGHKLGRNVVDFFKVAFDENWQNLDIATSGGKLADSIKDWAEGIFEPFNTAAANFFSTEFTIPVPDLSKWGTDVVNAMLDSLKAAWVNLTGWVDEQVASLGEKLNPANWFKGQEKEIDLPVPNVTVSVGQVEVEGTGSVLDVENILPTLSQSELDGWAHGIAEMLKESGKEIPNGVIEGLRSGEPAVQQEMVRQAYALVEAWNKELGIQSPSRVMIEGAGYVIDGVVQGLEAGTPRVEKAGADIATAVGESVETTKGIWETFTSWFSGKPIKPQYDDGSFSSQLVRTAAKEQELEDRRNANITARVNREEEANQKAYENRAAYYKSTAELEVKDIQNAQEGNDLTFEQVSAMYAKLIQKYVGYQDALDVIDQAIQEAHNRRNGEFVEKYGRSTDELVAIAWKRADVEAEISRGQLDLFSAQYEYAVLTGKLTLQDRIDLLKSIRNQEGLSAQDIIGIDTMLFNLRKERDEEYTNTVEENARRREEAARKELEAIQNLVQKGKYEVQFGYSNPQDVLAALAPIEAELQATADAMAAAGQTGTDEFGNVAQQLSTVQTAIDELNTSIQDGWLNKLTLQAKYGLRSLEDINGELNKAITRTRGEIGGIGSITSQEDLNRLNELNALLEKLLQTQEQVVSEGNANERARFEYLKQTGQLTNDQIRKDITTRLALEVKGTEGYYAALTELYEFDRTRREEMVEGWKATWEKLKGFAQNFGSSVSGMAAGVGFNAGMANDRADFSSDQEIAGLDELIAKEREAADAARQRLSDTENLTALTWGKITGQVEAANQNIISSLEERNTVADAAYKRERAFLAVQLLMAVGNADKQHQIRQQLQELDQQYTTDSTARAQELSAAQTQADNDRVTSARANTARLAQDAAQREANEEANRGRIQAADAARFEFLKAQGRITVEEERNHLAQQLANVNVLGAEWFRILGEISELDKQTWEQSAENQRTAYTSADGGLVTFSKRYIQVLNEQVREAKQLYGKDSEQFKEAVRRKQEYLESSTDYEQQKEEDLLRARYEAGMVSLEEWEAYWKERKRLAEEGTADEEEAEAELAQARADAAAAPYSQAAEGASALADGLGRIGNLLGGEGLGSVFSQLATDAGTALDSVAADLANVDLQGKITAQTLQSILGTAVSFVTGIVKNFATAQADANAQVARSKGYSEEATQGMYAEANAIDGLTQAFQGIISMNPYQILAGFVSYLTAAIGDLSNGTQQVREDFEEATQGMTMFTAEMVEGVARVQGAVGRVSRGGWLGLFGGTKEAIIDEDLKNQIVKMFADIESTIMNGFQQASQSMARGEMTQAQFEDALKKAVYDAIVNAITEAVLGAATVAERLGPLITEYVNALLSGDYEKAGEVLSQINTEVEMIAGELGPALLMLGKQAGAALGQGLEDGFSGAMPQFEVPKLPWMDSSYQANNPGAQNYWDITSGARQAAFNQQQQNRADAHQRRQQNESQAFQDRQQAASRAFQKSQQRASQAFQDRQRAQADAFQKQQEKQQEAFAKRQEQQRDAFQEKQERDRERFEAGQERQRERWDQQAERRQERFDAAAERREEAYDEVKRRRDRDWELKTRKWDREWQDETQARQDAFQEEQRQKQEAFNEEQRAADEAKQKEFEARQKAIDAQVEMEFATDALARETLELDYAKEMAKNARKQQLEADLRADEMAWEDQKRAAEKAFEDQQKLEEAAFNLKERALDDAHEAAAYARDTAHQALERSLDKQHEAAERALQKTFDNNEKAIDKAHNQTERAQEKAFSDRQKAQEKAFSEAQRQAEKRFSDAQEAKAKAFQRSQELASRRFQEQQENASYAFQKKQEKQSRAFQESQQREDERFQKNQQAREAAFAAEERRKEAEFWKQIWAKQMQVSLGLGSGPLQIDYGWSKPVALQPSGPSAPSAPSVGMKAMDPGAPSAFSPSSLGGTMTTMPRLPTPVGTGMDRGATNNNMTNTFNISATVRNDSDIDKISLAIADKLRRANRGI